MTIYTISNGVDTSFSTKLNATMQHSFTTGSSTVTFTPTNDSTNVVIMAKVNKDLGSVTSYDTGVYLNSDVDGDLDFARHSGYSGSSPQPVRVNSALLYAGSLTASEHTITFTSTGTAGTYSDYTITIMEFM